MRKDLRLVLKESRFLKGNTNFLLVRVSISLTLIHSMN